MHDGGLRTSSGGKGIRTPDLLTASQALYQLSYTPKSPLTLAVGGLVRYRHLSGASDVIGEWLAMVP